MQINYQHEKRVFGIKWIGLFSPGRRYFYENRYRKSAGAGPTRSHRDFSSRVTPSPPRHTPRRADRKTTATRNCHRAHTGERVLDLSSALPPGNPINPLINAREHAYECCECTERVVENLTSRYGMTFVLFDVFIRFPPPSTP